MRPGRKLGLLLWVVLAAPLGAQQPQAAKDNVVDIKPAQPRTRAPSTSSGRTTSASWAAGTRRPPAGRPPIS